MLYHHFARLALKEVLEGRLSSPDQNPPERKSFRTPTRRGHSRHRDKINLPLPADYLRVSDLNHKAHKEGTKNTKNLEN
jgi:hypothetical protein